MLVPTTIAAASAEEKAYEGTFLHDGDEFVESVSRNEQPLLDRLRMNLMFSPDFVSRWTWSRQVHRWEALNAAGLDIRKIISNRRQDIGTLVLQPYIVRRNELFMVPAHVEDRNDTELELHQLWFNLTSLARGRFRLRAGHMLVPFGLEPYTDTHFTIHQLISGANLGSKMDWGVSVNGDLAHFDYEVALLRGSGMEYADRGNNYGVAGRIGTRRDRNWILGFSGFHGQPIDRADSRRYSRSGGNSEPNDDVIRRWRLGYDVAGIHGPFTFLHELSFGRDFERDILNGLAEIGLRDRTERLRVYNQLALLGQRSRSGWRGDWRFAAGGTWQISESWSVGAEYRRDLRMFDDLQQVSIIGIQLRAHF